MRIAIVMQSLDVGGVESVMHSLGTWFAHRGHVVAYLATERSGSRSDLFDHAGDACRSMATGAMTSMYAKAKAIARALSGYDVVLLNHVPCARASLGLLPDRIVTVAVLHMGLPDQVKAAVGSDLDMDAVVAVSPWGAKAAIDSGADATRVVCIPNGVEVVGCSVSNVGSQDRLRVAFVGRIEDRQKAVMLLPDILSRVREEGVMVRLTVVGDGSDLSRLLTAMRDMCPDCELFAPGALKHDETMAVLERSDVLLMPSRFEGLSIAMLEAMARGVVPVASLLHGSTDCVIADGKEGLLVPNGDTAGFASCLIRLHRDRMLLRRLSFSAIQRVQQAFSHECMGLAYLNLIERLQGERFIRRSGLIDMSLLGDFPMLPRFLVRPVRKTMKLLGLFAPAMISGDV